MIKEILRTTNIFAEGSCEHCLRTINKGEPFYMIYCEEENYGHSICADCWKDDNYDVVSLYDSDYEYEPE